MPGFGARLADATSRRGRCAWASIPTPNCSTRGGCRETTTGWPGSATPASTRSPTSRWSSRRWRSSRRTAPRATPCWNARCTPCGRPACWCSPTPSAATSARRWRPTPPPGSADSPLAVDAVTASPVPRVRFAAARCSTSPRPSTRRVRAGGDVQPGGRRGATGPNGRPHGGAGDRRRRRGDQRTTLPEPGSVGVVVGATVQHVPDLGDLGGPVLVPGIGAQGGRAEGLAGLGGARPNTLLPAVSREVLRAGPDVTALRAAAERMRDAVAYLGQR